MIEGIVIAGFLMAFFFVFLVGLMWAVKKDRNRFNDTIGEKIDLTDELLARLDRLERHHPDILRERVRYHISHDWEETSE